MDKEQQNDIADSLNAFIGKDYAWPNWDEKSLGKAPQIVMPKFENKGEIAELNNVLSNISKMANSGSPNELRERLKALSGVAINIKDLKGNQESELGPIGSPFVRAQNGYVGNAPEISFNPNAWGRYPIEGDSSKHGIATPEQMMIHELGHYLEIQEIAKKISSANKNSNIPIAANQADNAAYEHATNEPHIVNDFENKVMSSIDPAYKKRDSSKYQDAEILFENRQGYPDVKDEERETLIQSMKVSGRAVPNELNMPNKVVWLNLEGGQSSDINILASTKVLDLHFEHLANHGFSPDNLASLKTLTSNILDSNAKNNTLAMMQLNEKNYSSSNELA